ncbi:MAG: sulfotransferase [Maritimibacter sp.]
MAGKTLIYCVGAAKAGTSWLFDYLYSHPECYFTPVKELHYWDSLEFGRGKFYRDQIPARIEAIRGRYEVTDGADQRAYQEANMAANQMWFDSFDGRSRDDDMYRDFIGLTGTDAKVVGDFTPAYGTLSVKWFSEMAKAAADSKFVMILREPVDRLWSHFRMDAGAGATQAALEKMDAFLDGGEKTVAMRSNYRRTINRIMEVVGRDRLHIEFYERLFSDAAIERFCAFLGIAPKAAAFDRKVHGTVEQSPLDGARRAKAQAVLKPQYNFIERFMGELPGEWTTRMVTA